MIKTIKLKSIIITICIFFIIFLIFYYKNFLFGNNIIKNRDRIENKILSNSQNYIAEIEVTVNSNKTSNSYIINQEVNDKYSMQEVKNDDNVKIELEGNTLKISNSKLNKEKVYENYSDLMNDNLFLDTFARDYKNEENDKEFYEKNNEIILEVQLNQSRNTYINKKILYVNRETLKPTKLEIKDNTNNETICIIYNNVEFK